MSFREITMQEISEVLRRWQAGQSARRIAREMGLDRKTVGRYVDEAKANSSPTEGNSTSENSPTLGRAHLESGQRTTGPSGRPTTLGLITSSPSLASWLDQGVH
jgi:hypothetical protein